MEVSGTGARCLQTNRGPQRPHWQEQHREGRREQDGAFSASPYVVSLVFLYLSLCGFTFLISLNCILVSCCIYIPFISMSSENTFQLSYCCVIVVFDRDQIMSFLIISDSNVFLWR